MDPKTETRLIALREEVRELLNLTLYTLVVCERMTPEGEKYVATWSHIPPDLVPSTLCMVTGNSEEEALRSLILLEESLIENDKGGL